MYIITFTSTFIDELIVSETQFLDGKYFNSPTTTSTRECVMRPMYVLRGTSWKIDQVLSFTVLIALYINTTCSYLEYM